MANGKQKSFEYFVLYSDLRDERRNVNNGKSLVEVSKFVQRVMNEKQSRNSK